MRRLFFQECKILDLISKGLISHSPPEAGAAPRVRDQQEVVAMQPQFKVIISRDCASGSNLPESPLDSVEGKQHRYAFAHEHCSHFNPILSI
jgi:hypothetical protein